MEYFFYYNGSEERPEQESVKTVDIVKGITDRTVIFNIYNRTLKFPYFGHNWNALYDCLLDLSFVQEKSIILFHHDIPLEKFSDDRRIYIELLYDVAKSWTDDPLHNLLIIFPQSAKNEIEAMINSYKQSIGEK